MRNTYAKEDITQIIIEYLANNFEINVESIDIGQGFIELEEIGLNSIYFVKMILDLEEVFDISFSDEKLLLDEYKNIKELIEYVYELVEHVD